MVFWGSRYIQKFQKSEFERFPSLREKLWVIDLDDNHLVDQIDQKKNQIGTLADGLHTGKRVKLRNI